MQKAVKNLKVSLLAAVIVSLASFFLKLTPCFKESKLSLCQIPSPFLDLVEPLPKYYNLSTNPILAIIIQFLVPFVLIYIVLLFSKVRQKKVIDFTKKSI
ncbi:hypothetical protein J4429_00475 [Candidatus Pacearchaeota archaeon]|nr:hypothetical protein [Candidatus Pacearchaeota archaeon]